MFQFDQSFVMSITCKFNGGLESTITGVTFLTQTEDDFVIRVLKRCEFHVKQTFPISNQREDQQSKLSFE